MVLEENDAAKIHPAYIPRRWSAILFYFFSSATGSVIGSKEHNAVQIAIPIVKHDGSLSGEFVNFAFKGKIRKQGYASECLIKLLQEQNLFPQ
ncbi:hypothetical protein MXB_2259 [Myxobolus squamalis]|nr:hypothetical protein MXB_2259 [Myxobolus squamalis]